MTYLIRHLLYNIMSTIASVLYPQNFIQISDDTSRKMVISTPLRFVSMICSANLKPAVKPVPQASLLHSFFIRLPTFSAFGQALDRLVTVSSTCCHASTPALSTLYSSRGLTPFGEGYLILRGASRLDAFSVYPFRTWLLCHAFG